MTVEIANALPNYFETLYDVNCKIILCCGIDVIIDNGQYEKPMQQMIVDIPRLIPYVFDKKSNTYVISEKDGLLEYYSEIPFLKNDYESILKNNYEFLEKIKTIRNKLEHKMNGIKLPSRGSGTFSLFDMTYKIDEDKEIILTSAEFIKFIKPLNEMFSKIQRMVSTFAWQEGKDSFTYYRRLTRFDFCKFNEIYDCDCLRSFGKIMLPF